MENNRLRHVVTKVLVDLMFFGGIVAWVALPFIMPLLLGFTGVYGGFRGQYTVVLMGAGACAIYILYQLRSMFKTLVGGNPFVPQNVSCLRKCAVASGVISLIFLARTLMWFTIAGAMVVVIFAILSLFCLTLKDLFKQAVSYKEETDWTV
ncbi:MAG: DUF2975 domain-containing protein [Defluviitaleaceae bacterium]|nr:DUF2975 domain-containing protein [Defluviitaleaceae bacterium]